MSVFSPASPADDDRGLRDTAPRRASPRVCPPTSSSCGSAPLSFPPGSGGGGGRGGEGNRAQMPSPLAVTSGLGLRSWHSEASPEAARAGVWLPARPRGAHSWGGSGGPPRRCGAEDMPRPSTDGEMNSFRCCL